MSEEPSIMYDPGAAVVASALAPQLGSDQRDSARGRTDMRRLSIIKESEIPFLLYAKIRGKKSRVWRTIYDELLNLKVSVGGRGRRDIIRMEGASKGGMASVSEEITRPNIIARNTWNRDWEDKERERLGM